MRLKVLWFILALLGAGLLLAGCRRGTPSEVPTPSASPASAVSSPTPARAPTESAAAATPAGTQPPVYQGTVTIWHSWEEPLLTALTQIIDDFSNQYPNIYFDVLYLPEEILRDRYQTALSQGAGPTILLAPAAWGPGLDDLGLVADLVPLAGSDLLARLNPAALGSGRYNGALISLPYRQEGVVLYRNRDLVGESPATFDDLVAIAKTTTYGEVVGAVLERSFFYSGGHLIGLGGELMDAEGRPAFNTEAGVAWIELLRNFDRAGISVFQSDQDIGAFEGGKAGFIIDGTWNRQALIDALGAESVAIDPWPTYPGGALAGFVQTDNIYLSAQAAGDNRDASWKFIEHFLSPEAQLALAEAGQIPVASGVQVTDPLIAEAMLALSGGVTYPLRPEMQAYADPLDVALKSVFETNEYAAEALANAAQEIEANLSGLSPTPSP